jgi:hypothetical protein
LEVGATEGGKGFLGGKGVAAPASCGGGGMRFPEVGGGGGGMRFPEVGGTSPGPLGAVGAVGGLEGLAVVVAEPVATADSTVAAPASSGCGGMRFPEVWGRSTQPT